MTKPVDWTRPIRLKCDNRKVELIEANAEVGHTRVALLKVHRTEGGHFYILRDMKTNEHVNAGRERVGCGLVVENVEPVLTQRFCNLYPLDDGMQQVEWVESRDCCDNRAGSRRIGIMIATYIDGKLDNISTEIF